MRDIADYAELSAQAKATYQGHNHRQAGDPAKLGTALVELAAAAAPPLRYAAGSDAVDAILGSLAERQDEIERWRALSVATDGNFAAAAAQLSPEENAACRQSPIPPSSPRSPCVPPSWARTEKP